MAQGATKVPEEAVHEVPALIEPKDDPTKDDALKDDPTVADQHAVADGLGVAASAALSAATAAAASVTLTTPTVANVVGAVGVSPVTSVTQVPGVPAVAKEEDSEEIPLVEVGEAMIAANEVFNRVKSEKIAEQALCSIRNDQAQYEGLAKEIVGKAIKQKERERANRASAAASRAKVLRYQTELESRLNRMEAERNAYRKEVAELRMQLEGGRKLNTDELKQLTKLQEWIRKMEAANPQFVRSVIAQGEMDKLLGETEEDKLEYRDTEEEDNGLKRRRVS